MAQSALSHFENITLTGNSGIQATSPIGLRVDPNGTNRNYQFYYRQRGTIHEVFNSADAAENLVMIDFDGVTTIITLNRGESAVFRCDGVSWAATVQTPAFTTLDSITLNPGTTSSTVLTFDMAQPSAIGQRDSHIELVRGTAYDTAGHNADWQRYVDVTSNAGVSSLLWQSRIDAAAFTTRLTLSDAGVLTPAAGDLGSLEGLATTGLGARTAADTWTTRSIVAPAAGISISNGDGVAGNPTLALANDLSGVEGLATTGLAARTAADTWATRSIVAPAAGISITNADGVAGNPTLALANDLSGLEGLATTGLSARTAADTWATRSIVAPAAGISISNGDGIAGNPTLALANDLSALEALGTSGFSARTGADAWAIRSLVAPAAGITITNPAGTAGDPTLALANDLAGVESLATNGLATRTGDGTWVTRSIVAPAAGITIANGDGVAGAPTLSLANDLSALEGLAVSGFAARTGADAWASRTLVAPAAGITISNPAGTAGDPTFALADDLSALEALDATAGLLAKTGANAYARRSIVAGTNSGFTIANGSGAAGDPTISRDKDDNFKSWGPQEMTLSEGPPVRASVGAGADVVDVMDFADAATQSVVLSLKIPGTAMTVRIDWTSGTTVGNVVFAASYKSSGDFSAAFPADITTTVAPPGVANNLGTQAIIAIAGTTAGQPAKLRIRRLGGDAADTHAATARVLQITVEEG